MKYMLLILAALALVGVAYADNCTQGWVCIDPGHLAYRNANCSYTNHTGCQYGCANYSCVPHNVTNYQISLDISPTLSPEGVPLLPRATATAIPSVNVWFEAVSGYIHFSRTPPIVSNSLGIAYTDFSGVPGTYTLKACYWSYEHWPPEFVCDLENVTFYETCTEGWKCMNDTTLNYQYLNCSWGENPYPCEYGCNLTTNQCNPCPEMWVCGSGNESICNGGWYKEWQTQYCTLINTTCCPYGCSNGECLGQNCTPGCSCVGNVRSCINETCAITNTTCQYGCSNGACNPCEQKWICTDSTHKGYKLSNCNVTNVTSCQYGCLNGACKSKPGPDPIQDSTKKKTTMAAAGVLGMGGSMDWVVVAILLLLVVGVCYFFLMKKK